MNDTVTKLVDALFSQTEMTDEAQALHDELMANCQERFSDLVSQGRSEDEAAALVMESLKGMEEVIESYPKRTAPKDENKGGGTRSFYGDFNIDVESFKDMGEKLAQDIKAMVNDEIGKAKRAFSSGDDGNRQTLVYEAEQIDAIDCSVRAYDITVQSTDGSELMIEYDEKSDSEELSVALEGSTLKITSHGRSGGKNSGWEWFSSRFFAQFGQTCDLKILVPESLIMSVKTYTQSGDIEISGIRLKSAEVSSTSGDILLKPALKDRLSHVSANTASGDIDMELAAMSINAKSMSGDLALRCDAREINASSVSGDVRFDGRFITGAAKSTSGDVRITCRDESLERVEARSVSGDIRVTLPYNVQGTQGKCSSVSGDVRNTMPFSADENGSVTVLASSVSGDVFVDKA